MRLWHFSAVLACLSCLLHIPVTYAQSDADTTIPDVLIPDSANQEQSDQLSESAPTTSAPSVDTQPPVITLDELVNGVADSTQVFTIQVSEETELQDVTLFYRRADQTNYSFALMTPLGSSGLFSTSIATDPTDLRPIEYYFQARDTAGNRTVSGFAFDPFSRNLTPGLKARAPIETIEEPAEQAPQSVQTTPFYKKRWVQVALGVVAVGVIASSLDTDDEEDTRIVPVTILFE